MSDRDTKIRERAHQIWEEEGRPSGRDRDHWERAAREIDDESTVAAISVGSSETTAKRPARAKRAAKPTRKRLTTT